MIRHSDQVLKVSDIMHELNIPRREAEGLLDRFGKRMNRTRVITQREFRFLQLKGEIARWLSTRH